MNAGEFIQYADTQLKAWLIGYRQVNQIAVECRHPAEDWLQEARDLYARGLYINARRHAADVLMMTCTPSGWLNLNVRPYASARWWFRN